MSPFGIIYVTGLQKLESCSHSRQRCKRCSERSSSQVTVRQVQKSMTRSCTDNTNNHHHDRLLNIHNFPNTRHNPSARVHSLDTPQVSVINSSCKGKQFIDLSIYLRLHMNYSRHSTDLWPPKQTLYRRPAVPSCSVWPPANQFQHLTDIFTMILKSIIIDFWLLWWPAKLKYLGQ